jgi:GR25 family glycosyltransferase involved in LPS biosynthesis
VAQLLADDLSAPSPAPWPDNRACNKKRATLSDEPLATLHEIHLINLDRSIDRLATFKDRNAHLKNILRFPAVNGALVNRDELVKSGIITDDLSYEPGALGCALSHIELWKKAASENRIVTIFEDDVICSLHFETESATFASALGEEWDFILWGYVFDPLYMWVDLGFSKAKLEFYDRRVHRDYQKFQCENFSRSSMKLAHSFGTQAYSVSPKGARALLENCLPLRDRYIAFPGAGVVTKDVGIDVAMCGAYDTLQAFVCIPPLVIQDNTQPSERLALNQTPHTQ